MNAHNNMSVRQRMEYATARELGNVFRSLFFSSKHLREILWHSYYTAIPQMVTYMRMHHLKPVEYIGKIKDILLQSDFIKEKNIMPSCPYDCNINCDFQYRADEIYYQTRAAMENGKNLDFLQDSWECRIKPEYCPRFNELHNKQR